MLGFKTCHTIPNPVQLFLNLVYQLAIPLLCARSTQFILERAQALVPLKLQGMQLRLELSRKAHLAICMDILTDAASVGDCAKSFFPRPLGLLESPAVVSVSSLFLSHCVSHRPGLSSKQVVL